jgi:RES domain-containing protein
MLVYRIGKSKYSGDISGEGARLNAGRWNHKGTPCIYTSESRALALLEYTSHVSASEVPRALSFSTLQVPDDSAYEFSVAELPGNWRNSPHPNDCRNFGTMFLQKAEYLLLKIPSVIIPEEFNYIINPLHPEIKKVKVLSAADHVFDLRLKV